MHSAPAPDPPPPPPRPAALPEKPCAPPRVSPRESTGHFGSWTERHIHVVTAVMGTGNEQGSFSQPLPQKIINCGRRRREIKKKETLKPP